MPDRRNNPEAQSETDMLRQEVAGLTVTFAALERKLGDVLTVEEAKSQFPTRQEARRTRRRTAWTVASSVLIAFVVTLAGDNLAIKHCFLGSTSSQHPSLFCNTAFPGYNHVMHEQQARLDQFDKLIATIPANAQRNREQSAQIAQLRREVADLRRRVGRH
jgi:hypothetical protein